VHCLVRSESDAHGFERIRAVMEHSELWDDAFASRIRVVVGDLRSVRFGLSTEEFDALCRRIDAVYHVAADVSLVGAYARATAYKVIVLSTTYLGRHRSEPPGFSSSCS